MAKQTTDITASFLSYLSPSQFTRYLEKQKQLNNAILNPELQDSESLLVESLDSSAHGTPALTHTPSDLLDLNISHKPGNSVAPPESNSISNSSHSAAPPVLNSPSNSWNQHGYSSAPPVLNSLSNSWNQHVYSATPPVLNSLSSSWNQHGYSAAPSDPTNNLPDLKFHMGLTSKGRPGKSQCRPSIPYKKRINKDPTKISENV